MKHIRFEGIRLVLIPVALMLSNGTACGGDGAVRDVSPEEAHRLMGEKPEAVLIDVRSQAEYEFVGHPENAYNIPLMFWDPNAGGFTPNPRFDEEVAARFERDRPVLLICRSGGRSARAAKRLADLGFEEVYDISEGVEGSKDAQGHRTVDGWINRGLPYTHAVDDARKYRPSP